MGPKDGASSHDLYCHIQERLKKPIMFSPFVESDGLGDALRMAFFQFYGLEPMQDPRMDAAFLTCMEGVLSFAAGRIESAFYGSENAVEE